jgi:hypothetical protein
MGRDLRLDSEGIMDKNIAAIIRENTFTIEVLFYKDTKYYEDSRGNVHLDPLGDKAYHYVTMDKTIKVDDHVVVLVAGVPKVVKVVTIHDDLMIKPNETKEVKWVVCKVDMEAYNSLMKENDEITRLITKSYRKSTRHQLQALMLADAGDEERAKLLAILK